MALALAFALLSGFFILRGFPYELLGRRLATGLESATSARVAFATLEPRMTLAGPGLEATGLSVTTSGGTRLNAKRAFVRSAWSPSWLSLAPAFYVDLDAELGRVAGVVTLGAEPGFRGRVEDLDLARMPTDAAWSGLSLGGRARVDLDLRATGAGAVGGAILHAEQGSVQTAGLPMAIPFEQLDAELLFGNGNLLEVSSLTFAGPMLSAQLSGTVGQAPSSASAPLDLQLDYQVEAAMRSTFQSAGLELDRDGKGQIRIRGTPSAPDLR